MAEMAYGLEGFVQELDSLIERGEQDHQLVKGATTAMRRLLADMRWLEPPYWQTDDGDHAQYLLRRHPAGAYVILSVVFPEGYSTPVHDHDAWGVVGVWRGAEREERFKRVDKAERADYAELRSARTLVNTPGSVTWLMPPNEDIHRISNVAPYPSCSIHVYGGTLNRRTYDLRTGRVTPWPVQLKSLV